MQGSADFNRDGGRLAISSDKKSIELWDTLTGSRLGDPLRSDSECFFLKAFSPNGDRLVTSSGGGNYDIWDLRTRETIGSPIEFEGPVDKVVFSSDGRFIGFVYDYDQANLR